MTTQKHITVNTFKDCGLDIEKNILTGIGDNLESICIILQSEQDIFDFIYNILEEEECNQCGLFIIDNDLIHFGIKYFDEIGEVCISPYTAKLGGELRDVTDFNGIGSIAEKLELHCYGLMARRDSERFEIIME